MLPKASLVATAVALAAVLSVGVLSPFPDWAALVAAAVVGLVAPVVVGHYREQALEAEEG